VYIYLYVYAHIYTYINVKSPTALARLAKATEELRVFEIASEEAVAEMELYIYVNV
jgi:hypothetical protein